jgi:hypothetical protein
MDARMHTNVLRDEKRAERGQHKTRQWMLAERRYSAGKKQVSRDCEFA